MSKTKTKMELVDTSESTEFKKTRMKEIRAMVSNALKKNQRIDLMDFTGTDIPRVMVALQDEVMDARNRHAKATKHIAEAKEIMKIIMPPVEATIKLQSRVIDQLHNENEELSEQLFIERSASQQVIEGINADRITQARELEALRHTVSVLR